jgi:hypothetical protein
VIAWWRQVILAASCCDLAAGAVTAWWALPGYVAGVLFALFFLAAGAVLMVAGFKASLRLLVAGLVLTVISVLEPAGGVLPVQRSTNPRAWEQSSHLLRARCRLLGQRQF